MTLLNPMQMAFAEAEKAAQRGEVPVGACLYDPAAQKIIAACGNWVEAEKQPYAHAEMLALQKGAEILNKKWLDGLDLYVTLEPCPMCASAISLYRIRRLYFAAYDPKSGGVDHGPKIFDHHTCHHRPEVYGGIEEDKAAKLMQDFFRSKRA